MLPAFLFSFIYIFLIEPKIKEWEKPKMEKSIQNGKVFYGFGYRWLWCLLLVGSIIGAIVMTVLFNFIESLSVVLVGLAVGGLFSLLFVQVYRKKFTKAYLSDQSTSESVQEAIESQPTEPIKTNEVRPDRDRRLDALEAYYEKRLEREKTLKWGIICILLVVAIIVGAIAYCLGRYTSYDKGATDGFREGYNAGYKEKKEPSPQTRPLSETILWDVGDNDGAHLTVTAHSGSDVVVAVKDMQGTIRRSFYVRAGETAFMRVPATYLYVYFISGTTWYGYGDGLMFGENTSYAMDEDIQDFSNNYFGVVYTLSPVVDGNFHETPIEKDDFFE